MRKTGLFLCLLLAFTACSKDSIRISGHISGVADSVLYLDEVDVYNTVTLDSIKLKSNGKFSFTLKDKLSGFYQLRLSDNKIILLFPKPGDHVTVEADGKVMQTSAKISGSHDSEQIAKLMGLLNETRTVLDSITAEYESAADDSLRARLNKEFNNVLEKHRKSSIAYILTNYNSLSSVYAIYQQYRPGYYVFYKTTDLQYFRILSDSLSKYHPRSKHVASLKAYTKRQLDKYQSQLLIQNARVESLPPVRLPDFAGDTIRLSSLKGKFVLLSFWVSTNQACVEHNLAMKKVYAQFRNKGFEIYQVSLDNSPERWIRAVKYDELPWISVIDNSSGSVVAGNYNVAQVPANYLIGKDHSTILGKNLTPDQVQSKLQDLTN
jgi:peroxiredoxin